MERTERLTASILPRLFEEYTGRELTLREGDRDAGVDFIGLTPEGLTFAIEVVSSGRVAQVARAARQAREAAADSDGAPLVVAPYIGPAGADAARTEAVNYVDLSGNASIRVGELVVHVEGRPNQFPERGRPSSSFAPRSSRIARVLLVDPTRWWRQAELSRTTKLPSGSVSKIVARLDSEDLLETNRDRAIRPRDPGMLLDAWAEEYDFGRHDIVSAHVPGTSGSWLAEVLAAQLETKGQRYAVTGLAAAWAYDQYASFRLVTVYLQDRIDETLEAMGARLGSKGANLQIVVPNDEGVFYESQKAQGMVCAAPVQTYLDLQGLPERAQDAARHLRAKRLDWRR